MAPHRRAFASVRQRGLALLGVAVMVAACVASESPTLVPLKTQSSGSHCLLALTTAQLVADPTSGVALAGADASRRQVFWPSGWTDRLDGGVIAVVDERGTIVAHVGDTVSMGGGGPDPWYVCPPVTVEPSPTAAAK